MDSKLITDIETVLERHRARLRASAPTCPVGFGEAQTGGGCTAWSYYAGSVIDRCAYQVMITEEGGATVPDAFPVTVGVYETDEGDTVKLWPTVSEADYARVVEEARTLCEACAASVYHYFFEKFGVHSEDTTLRELPVDSGCGDDCKRAIDAGKALIDLPEMGCAIEPVSHAVDQAVIVYWRG